MARIIRIILFITLIIVIPFILLIRISVFYHVKYEYHPYICTALGVMFTGVVLLFYFTVLHTGLMGKKSTLAGLKFRSMMALALVFAYTMHGLLFFSEKNAKHPDVRKEYRQLHPILRLGVSTLTHVDKKLILTDAERKPEDYRAMGLRSKSQSLHYPQKDGFVYALDIRTNGRSELANFLVKWYFRLMGFRSTRHVGTSDHLHISLYNHERPYAI